uniref:Progesterone receptor n=1 Tax=Leptobrachium leishanense TaxID=445787 RepID=A0A8C5LQ12_9ANUR
MEEKKEGTNTTGPSSQSCPGAVATSRYPLRSEGQVDNMLEVSNPTALSLDSLFSQRMEDEDSYLKGEGPISSDNNELQRVLDTILDLTPSHLDSWSEFIVPELTTLLSSSPKFRTPGGHLTDQVSIWSEGTVPKIEGTDESMPSKAKEKATMEEVNVEAFAIKTDHYEAVSTTCSSIPTKLNLITMPAFTLNPKYLVTRTAQVLNVEESNLKSISPSLSQHMATCAIPQPDTKQVSYLPPALHPDAKIKEEDHEISYLKATIVPMGPDFRITTQQSRNPDPDESLDFSLHRGDLATVYDPFRGSHGRGTDSPYCILPSTSTAPQNLYQPLSLSSQQHLVYQSTALKENYLQHLQLPFIQYISETDQSSSYSFASLPQKICLICADEASGCHYGVLTCGSCKVFFKRAIEGRKFKKFSKMKSGRDADAIVLQQPLVIPVEYQQALTRRMSASTAHEIQYIPELLQILQSIEPEVVYAGYDNSQPETPSALLSSLNQLCERQLMCVVKWSKSLPGFRTLHIDDQITLLQYSWMSLMVFAMGWRSYKHVSGQMLYFAPDLILNEQRMKDSSFYSLCVSMRQLPQEFVKLQVTHEEFLCMKALLLLNTIPLEGLKSQSLFDEMRSNYIRELGKAISLRHKGVVASSQRFYNLTKIMDAMHELVKQLHLYCLNTFLQSRTLSVEFPEMMSEVISAQLPKILAGMVKPLVFHKKSGDFPSPDKA